jgi:ATP-binding cassette subfamily B protein
MVNSFPFYKQLDAMDCGPSCLRMITKYYGRAFSLQALRDKCFVSREGVSLLGISDGAESIGLRTLPARLSMKNLAENSPLPCIVYWRQRHFVVVYKIKKNIVYIADPAHGLLKLTTKEFEHGWINTTGEEDPEGFALFLEPGPEFYKTSQEENERKIGFKHFFYYLYIYRKYLFQIFLSLFIVTIIQLIIPFSTQAIVDIGINNKDLGFIYLILLAQIVLFISRSSTEIIRGWLLLHITIRINISVLSDFLAKIMKLPVSFFDKKRTGDLLQRLADHTNIESFLTRSCIHALFSIINLLTFGAILALYNLPLFGIFFAGSVLYLLWIIIFLKRRKDLNYKFFEQSAEIQNATIQLLTGIQEIKLQSCEKQKRWEWERIQAKIFKLNLKTLALGQIEGNGASFINEIKNILITFYAAKTVIDGEMTLGMMLAAQFIIGQLNGPILALIEFIQSAQSAKISLERLGEIHNIKDEEDNSLPLEPAEKGQDIVIKNLSFQYGSKRSPYVIKDLNLTIPYGKVTAIVGSSGSGKTTLLKLLLKFYSCNEGSINFGSTNINNIRYSIWRKKFGVVMQESFVFSESIARNLTVGEEQIDKEKLKHAINVANIKELIETLPIGYNTKIGQDGQGLSQGQRQRLLIARAVYKDPEILLLDEATNSLDANTEKTILNNLTEFYKGRTVVVVAHRLSTVKNADQIVVLDKGQIIETGNHKELIEAKGSYYNLVSNQLELGT